MSTKVKNPCMRGGWKSFSTCFMCGEVFTALGIGRHWDKCKKATPEFKARQQENRK